MNMSYGYLIDKTGLSNILAQLLEPPSQPRKDRNQDCELTEESDLALALRLLLEPEPTESPAAAAVLGQKSAAPVPEM